MTALERFGAAYLTFGLSLRIEQLAELDRRDDASAAEIGAPTH